MPYMHIPGTQRITIPKGTTIIQQGTKLTHLYYVEKGAITREFENNNGANVVTLIRTPSHKNPTSALVGVLILFDELESGLISNANFVTYTDCVCQKIPVDPFYREVYQDVAFYQDLLRSTLHEYHRLSMMYYTASLNNKMAVFAMDMLNHAEYKEDGSLIYQQPFTNKVMSEVLHVHPVTVSKMYQALEEEGIIERTRRTVSILDRDRLAKIASGELFISYHYKAKE